jgi:uncharacterized protein (DUF2141 family)
MYLLLFHFLGIAFSVIYPGYVKSSNQENNHSLIINISGIKNQNGMILLSLFNSEDGFPGEREKAFRIIEQEIKKDEVVVVLKNLPSGTYAVSLIHDENNNKKLDTNFIGIPKEGYGASNNVKKAFRAPRFDEAAFKIEEGQKEIEIEMIYL